MSSPTPPTVEQMLTRLIALLTADGMSQDEAHAIAELARPYYERLIPRPASEGHYGRTHPVPDHPSSH